MLKLRRRQGLLIPVTLALLIAILIAGYLYLARPLPEFLVAKRDLAAGETISEQDFSKVALDLGPVAISYLSPENILVGSKLSNPIRAGELVAIDNLNGFSAPGQTVIKFQPKLPLAQSLSVGDRVSLWRVQVESLGEALPAELVVAIGTIQAIEFSEGLFNDELPFVEIALPEATVPFLLQSLSAGFDVYAVAPGSI